MRISMQHDEVNCIERYLSKRHIMLEYGAGGSTLHFSRFVKRYYSIEHSKKWFESIKDVIEKECIRNVEIFLVKNNKPRTENTKREQFKDYVEFVHQLGLQFDIVFIDGRARKFCAKEILPYLHENSIVFIHDFDRGRYHSILEDYNEIERVKTLVVLKKKYENGKNPSI